MSESSTLTPPAIDHHTSAGEPAGAGGPDPDAAALVPLERLEARICELAGHLAAASARFLALVGEFDARRGWACWDLPSCAAWLAWKCQVAPGTAREQVRVARALHELPALAGEFAAGRMSYAKVRALTRIATPATEAVLAEVAGPMTAAQCERFTAAHRTASDAGELAARADVNFAGNQGAAVHAAQGARSGRRLAVVGIVMGIPMRDRRSRRRRRCRSAPRPGWTTGPASSAYRRRSGTRTRRRPRHEPRGPAGSSPSGRP
jgi:hypothetical protein